MSFKIPANQTTAFVSQSGEGKSTIFNLLFRYYTPIKGTIKINDQDISITNLNSIQNSISLFGQNPNLFKGTVRQNICYGSTDQKRITDSDIWKIADLIGFSEFLRNLPEHLDTNVGDAGKALSGGQQQKIAILRGLFKPSSIRIFDESTASLDCESAEQFLRGIKNISKNITTLITSHKLTETQYADKIIVLDKGRVVAQGSHSQLLSSCGLYRKLWEMNLKNNAQQPIKRLFPNGLFSNKTMSIKNAFNDTPNNTPQLD